MNITHQSSKDAIITSSLECLDYQDAKLRKVQNQRNILLVLFTITALLYSL
jgi:hypothetical protein